MTPRYEIPRAELELLLRLDSNLASIHAHAPIVVQLSLFYMPIEQW